MTQTQTTTTLRTVATVVAAMGIGLAIGSWAAAEDRDAATAAASAPGSERVEVAREECIEALDLARDVFDANARFADIMVRFLEAASDMDVDTMSEESSKIAPITAEVRRLGPRFNAAADLCEA